MELGCTQWSDYEDKSLTEMRLCSETEVPEDVLCEMLEKNSSQRESPHRKKILTALAHRWHMSSMLLGITANFMDDEDENVRRAAVRALGTLSPCPPPPKILQAVTCRLIDEDWDVSRAAVEALGTHCPLPTPRSCRRSCAY